MLHIRPGDDVQAVLDSAEPGSLIHFAAGEYRQKLMLRTPGLCLEGEGAERTALIWDDYAKKLDGQGREYNTFRTWTENTPERRIVIHFETFYPPKYDSQGRDLASDIACETERWIADHPDQWSWNYHQNFVV